MHPALELVTRFSAAAAGSLIASTWEAGLLALIVWICLRLVPGVSAAIRSLIWGCAFLLVGAIPFLHVGSAGGGSGVGAAHVSLNANWAIAIVVFWLAFSLFRVGQLIRSAVHLSGVARRAQWIEFAETTAKVCVSSEIDVPCVAGFFAPRILIPAHLLGSLSAGDMEQIVAHEAAHVRRFDHWTNLAQKVLVAAYPIHPVLLWIERQLCVERELACDDAVMQRTGARKQYALCLTNLAEQSLARRGFTLALRAWGRQPELTRRVLRILGRPGQELSPAHAAVLVAGLVMVLVGGAAGLSRVPALVGFRAVPAVIEQTATVHSALEPTFGAKATLVKASMDLPAKPVQRITVKASTAKKRTRIVERSTDLKLAELPAPQRPARAAGWVMLTTWQADETPRLQPAIIDSNFSYAAVPTRNGWLIIQL